jgi:hypothetical protein
MGWGGDCRKFNPFKSQKGWNEIVGGGMKSNRSRSTEIHVSRPLDTKKGDTFNSNPIHLYLSDWHALNGGRLISIDPHNRVNAGWRCRMGGP